MSNSFVLAHIASITDSARSSFLYSREMHSSKSTEATDGGGRGERTTISYGSHGSIGGATGVEGIIRKWVSGWTNPEGQAWLPACVKDGLSLKGDREERREDLGREEMKYIVCRPGYYSALLL